MVGVALPRATAWAPRAWPDWRLALGVTGTRVTRHAVALARFLTSEAQRRIARRAPNPHAAHTDPASSRTPGWEITRRSPAATAVTPYYLMPSITVQPAVGGARGVKSLPRACATRDISSCISWETHPGAR
jgi:hypothetical protein